MVGAFTMTCRFCNSRSVLVPADLVPNPLRTGDLLIRHL